MATSHNPLTAMKKSENTGNGTHDEIQNGGIPGDKNGAENTKQSPENEDTRQEKQSLSKDGSVPDQEKQSPSKADSVPEQEETESGRENLQDEQNNELSEQSVSPTGIDKKSSPKDDSSGQDQSEDKPKDTGKEKRADAVPVNYEQMKQEDLVKRMEEQLSTMAIDQLKDDVEKIRNVFYRKHEEELEAKRKKFISEGGNPEDFKPVDDPLEVKMRELVDTYKTRKAEYNKLLEKSKQENLERKLAILEEFRELMEGQHSFDTTFRKFKQLQKKWFDTGIVPQQNVKDLWNNYNYFVDKFNDYVHINRELKALDLKKNLEEKIKLCEKAEALTAEENVINAFKILQKYHNRWREIGPVPREEKDAIWERFKAATSIINRAHQEHQSKMKDQLVENLQKKTILCEKAEELAGEAYTTHKEWVSKTNELLNLQKEWKTIGYAPKKDNNAIYARFRKACDQFFENKAAFYAKTFEEQKENLVVKQEIVEEAESIRDSEEWKETTDRLINLQKKWKEVGHVPKRDSDRLWKRFRAACDHFFGRKSDFFNNIDSSYAENLKEKEKIVEEVSNYQLPGDQEQALKDLEKFQERFAAIGFVPVSKKNVIRDDFRDALEMVYDKLGMDEHEKVIYKFKNRIRNILHSPKSDVKMGYERDKLINKLQQLKSDISVWENNIGFIKQTDSADDTLSNFQEKLDDARERIEIMEEKLRIMDDLESELEN